MSQQARVGPVYARVARARSAVALAKRSTTAERQDQAQGKKKRKSEEGVNKIPVLRERARLFDDGSMGSMARAKRLRSQGIER